MKQTTETMNRAAGQTMEHKPEAQMKQVRILRNFRATQLSITAQGLALRGTYDSEPLSASVQGAPDENHPVAA